MKRWLLLFPFLFLLSGCWDYNEATMQEYVLGIGIDLEQNGDYLVTIETADLSGSPESQSGSQLLETSGANLFDAIRNAIPHAGKKLYWGHCALIVFHEDIAGARLHEVLDVFHRAQDVYLNTAIAVASGVSAQEIFRGEHNGSDSVTAHCLNVFQNQDSSRRFHRTELWQYTRDLALRGLVMLPSVTLNDKTPSVSGGFLYRGSDFVAQLSGEEVLLCSLLSEEISGGWLSEIELSPTSSVSLEILSNHTKRDAQKISPMLTVSLSSANVFLKLQDQAVRKEIESALAQVLQKRFSAFTDRARREGFSSLLGLDGDESLPIHVTVRLHNTGMYHNQPEDRT